MHRPIVWENAEADTLIMFIHGIMGSPNQFHRLIEAVYQQGCSAVAVLLPGHGGSVRDYGRSGLADWENHLQSELNRYAGTYQNIFLVGHSMGGLLALNASLHPKNRFCGVFMIAAPLKVNLGPRSMLSRVKLWTLPSNRAFKAAYLQAKSVSGVIPLRLKPYYELNRLIKKTAANLPRIDTPVVIIHSKQDEAVSFQSADILYQGLVNAAKTRITLNQSRHAYYTEEESAVVRAALLDFIRQSGVGKSLPGI